MTETLLVLAALLLTSVAAWLLPALSAETLVFGGWLLTAAGLAVGLPTGTAYHVVLRSCLRENGRLPQRWWLNPIALHDLLDAGQRRRVTRWFALGGAGFAASVAGCALVAAGVVLQGFRAGVF